MPREHDAYRDNLERLAEYFGCDKNWVKAKDVGQYCGCDRRTAARRFDIPPEGISLPTLAREMCRSRKKRR